MAQQGKILDTLAVIGVGLIGGSLAGALKASGAVGTVVGVGRNPENLATALDRGFVDHVTIDLAEAVSEADVVLLATPVNSLVKSAAKQFVDWLACDLADNVPQGNVNCSQRIEIVSAVVAPDTHQVIKPVMDDLDVKRV